MRKQPLLFALVIVFIVTLILLPSKNHPDKTLIQSIKSKSAILLTSIHIKEIYAHANKKEYTTVTIAGSVQRINSSLIFPFGESPIIQNISTEQFGLTADQGIISHRTVTFNNLTNFQSESQASNFTCPKDLPYAINYTLEFSLQNMIVYGQKYLNACGFSMPKKYDILFGAAQVPGWQAQAKDVTGFVPKSTPEGCQNSHSNVIVAIRIPESSIQITPITTIVNQESIIVGYQEQNQGLVDCNQVCNRMLDEACNSDDPTSCTQTVSAVYKVKGSYQLRQTPEYFCSCSIYSPANIHSPAYTYARVIDIESAINYNNQLSSVTCSNYPTDQQ